MDTLRIEPTKWRTMNAWSISNGTLEVVVTEIGCHLAAVRFVGETTNAFWQPHWPTCQPDRIDPNTNGPYGVGSEAPLLGCIVGHNLCIDRFGEPWAGEHRPMHGEAGVSMWTLAQAGATAVELCATLIEANLAVRRRIRIDGSTLLLTTGVRHDGPSAREIEWCEHVTLGDPFLDGVRI